MCSDLFDPSSEQDSFGSTCDVMKYTLLCNRRSILTDCRVASNRRPETLLGARWNRATSSSTDYTTGGSTAMSLVVGPTTDRMLPTGCTMAANGPRRLWEPPIPLCWTRLSLSVPRPWASLGAATVACDGGLPLMLTYAE